jgi:hypothetical protein
MAESLIPVATPAAAQAAVTPEVKTVTTPVVETPEVKTEKPALTEIEQRALDQGWKPLEEWEGDPNDHRSAKEYIDRGELLGKIKNQSSEIREIKQMLSTLSEHNKKVYIAGREAALNELKQLRVHALKEGEMEQAVAIEERIAENQNLINITKNTPAPAVTQSTQNTPAFESWLTTNKWYETDEAMRNWADGAAMALGKKARESGRQIGEQDVYDHLTKEARKTFPQKFQRVGAPSPDGEGRKAMQNTKSGKSGDAFEQLLSTFDEQAQKVARNLVNSKILTKEKYVEDYERIGQ